MSAPASCLSYSASELFVFNALSDIRAWHVPLYVRPT